MNTESRLCREYASNVIEPVRLNHQNAAGTTTCFLWLQVRYASKDLSQVRPVIEDYSKTQGPAMDDFARKLADYGRLHSDFNAIYTKYGLNQVTQAPASTIAPKK